MVANIPCLAMLFYFYNLYSILGLLEEEITRLQLGNSKWPHNGRTVSIRFFDSLFSGVMHILFNPSSHQVMLFHYSSIALIQPWFSPVEMQ